MLTSTHENNLLNADVKNQQLTSMWYIVLFKCEWEGSSNRYICTKYSFKITRYCKIVGLNSSKTSVTRKTKQNKKAQWQYLEINVMCDLGWILEKQGCQLLTSISRQLVNISMDCILDKSIMKWTISHGISVLWLLRNVFVFSRFKFKYLETVMNEIWNAQMIQPKRVCTHACAQCVFRNAPNVAKCSELANLRGNC